jgi:ATP-dependent Clp protease protease subunit
MGFYLNTKQPTMDEDSDESSDVEEVSNHIYFYTSVTKKSIFELNKKLISSSTGLEDFKNTYEVEIPEIKLHINSPGGSLLDCFAAVDYIRNSKAPVHSMVEGSAASAATLMSVVAKKRSISKHSFMLIHQLSGGMWGKFEEMKDDMENCNVFMNIINEIYTKHTKIPKTVLKDILKRDIYMDAKTCLKYGLVDKILE